MEPSLAARDALELRAATLLGQILFAFSRLDVNLGLCLVWQQAYADRPLPELTAQVEEWSFGERLAALERVVAKVFPAGGAEQQAYAAWIVEAQRLRRQRNDLIHGRWGVEATRDKVVNVLGLPTADAPRAVEYSLDELAAIHDTLLQSLRVLSRLRDRWPP